MCTIQHQVQFVDTFTRLLASLFNNSTPERCSLRLKQALVATKKTRGGGLLFLVNTCGEIFNLPTHPDHLILYLTSWYSCNWNGGPAELLTSICTGSFSPIEDNRWWWQNRKSGKNEDTQLQECAIPPLPSPCPLCLKRSGYISGYLFLGYLFLSNMVNSRDFLITWLWYFRKTSRFPNFWILSAWVTRPEKRTKSSQLEVRAPKLPVNR